LILLKFIVLLHKSLDSKGSSEEHSRTTFITSGEDISVSIITLVETLVKGGSHSILPGIGRTWDLNLRVAKGLHGLLPTLMQILMTGVIIYPMTNVTWTGRRY
jgi:hypothetical protein